MKGRKRHLLVDSMGLLLVAVVHSAAIQDRDGAKLVLTEARKLFTRLQFVWADGGYAGQLVGWVCDRLGWGLGIVKRTDGEKGFVLQPHRWIVERTLGWLSHYRVMSRDYEALPEVSEANIHIAMLHLMLQRPTFKNPS